jgi:hypothetical protein
MTTESETFREALFRVLEAEPRQFIAVATQTNALPGAPRARDYNEAEMDQLNSGFVRLLLEALRNDDPKFRSMFMEVAIPSFIRQGETPASLVRWNVSYLVLFGAALAARVRSEHQRDVLNWFAAFSGLYLADVLRAASKASDLSPSAVR